MLDPAAQEVADPAAEQRPGQSADDRAGAILALEIAARAYVMESGAITLSGAAREIVNDPKVVAAYLGGEAA